MSPIGSGQSTHFAVAEVDLRWAEPTGDELIGDESIACLFTQDFDQAIANDVAPDVVAFFVEVQLIVDEQVFSRLIVVRQKRFRRRDEVNVGLGKANFSQHRVQFANFWPGVVA